MKIGLIISIAVMMVFSTSVSVMGNMIKQDAKDKQLDTSSIPRLQVGDIKIYTRDHETCDDPVIEITTFNHINLDPGEYSKNYWLYATYSIECPGADDEATIEMSFESSQSINVKYGKGGPDGEPPLTGELEILISVYPEETPSVKEVSIEAVYYDFITWGRKVIAGPLIKTADIRVKDPVPEFYCSVSNGGTITLTGEIKESTWKNLKIKNNGMKYSELTFIVDDSHIKGYVESVEDTDKEITLKKGGTSEKNIRIYTKQLPRWEMENLDGGYLLIDVTGDGGLSIQNYRVNIEIDVVHKKAKNMAMPLFNLQECFPLLFNLLQSLSVF
jgi:hypothetical protein